MKENFWRKWTGSFINYIVGFIDVFSFPNLSFVYNKHAQFFVCQSPGYQSLKNWHKVLALADGFWNVSVSHFLYNYL